MLNQKLNVNKHSQFILVPQWSGPPRSAIARSTASLVCVFCLVGKLAEQKLVSSLWHSDES